LPSNATDRRLIDDSDSETRDAVARDGAILTGIVYRCRKDVSIVRVNSDVIREAAEYGRS
jgi:hypothetical protein